MPHSEPLPHEQALMCRLRAVLDPALLSPLHRKIWHEGNPTQGFCSVASEALYFLPARAPAGWVAHVGRDPKGGTHWWLVHTTGRRLDPTAEQYLTQNLDPPYARGRPGGFMGMRADPRSPWGFGRRPGLRAGALLDRFCAAEDVSPRDHAALLSALVRWRTPCVPSAASFRVR